jgi:hypothetical protein
MIMNEYRLSVDRRLSYRIAANRLFLERYISFLLSFHKKYRYFSCSPENNAVIGGYVNAEKLGEE